MPIHDWTRVEAGTFHHFHQHWITGLCAALNSGRLPEGYFAMAEQVVSGPIPDVLTLHQQEGENASPSAGDGGAALKTAPPRARFVRRTEEELYLEKVDRVTVRHRHGAVIAVLEVVSPGNKASRHAIRSFVTKLAELYYQGVHLLAVDLFPPGPPGPQGLHKLIWDEVVEEDFALPVDKPLTLAAYEAGPVKTAYVEPVAVGDALPDRPLFLGRGGYIDAPLEETYRTAWQVFPAPLKGLLEGPAAQS